MFNFIPLIGFSLWNKCRYVILYQNFNIIIILACNNNNVLIPSQINYYLKNETDFFQNYFSTYYIMKTRLLILFSDRWSHKKKKEPIPKNDAVVFVFNIWYDIRWFWCIDILIISRRNQRKPYWSRHVISIGWLKSVSTGLRVGYRIVPLRAVKILSSRINRETIRHASCNNIRRV